MLLTQVEAAAAAQDLATVTGYLSVRSLPVQLVVIKHLGILGDASTIEALKAQVDGLVGVDPQHEVIVPADEEGGRHVA